MIDARNDKCRYSLYSNFIFDISIYLTLSFCESCSREICRHGVCRKEGKPKLFDSNLKISTVTEGLSTPTNMAFVGPGDVLVT